MSEQDFTKLFARNGVDGDLQTPQVHAAILAMGGRGEQTEAEPGAVALLLALTQQRDAAPEPVLVFERLH